MVLSASGSSVTRKVEMLERTLSTKPHDLAVGSHADELPIQSNKLPGHRYGYEQLSIHRHSWGAGWYGLLRHHVPFTGGPSFIQIR